MGFKGGFIMKGKLEKIAKEILKDFPQIKEQPASLSAKNHFGETSLQHLEYTASIMRHLCDSLNIHGEDRDMLIACAYLHDLGIYIITCKGKMNGSEWTYYKKTGWSRRNAWMPYHAKLSADILEEYNIPRKEEIQKIISTHMNHWYKNTPKATNLYEYLMVEADYLATRKKLLKFNGENKNE